MYNLVVDTSLRSESYDNLVIVHLLENLSQTNLKLVEASARALRCIMCSKEKSNFTFQEHHFEVMCGFLDITSSIKESDDSSQRILKFKTLELMTTVISRSLSTLDYTTSTSIYTRVIKHLLALLDYQTEYCPNLQECVADAIAILCRNCSDVCSQITHFESLNFIFLVYSLMIV